MKVKLDENLPTRLLVALRQRGHDVQTVPEENLTGAQIRTSGPPLSKKGDS